MRAAERVIVYHRKCIKQQYAFLISLKGVSLVLCYEILNDLTTALRIGGGVEPALWKQNLKAAWNNGEKLNCYVM